MGGRLGTVAARIVAREAAAWGISSRAAWGLLVLPLALTAGIATLAAFRPLFVAVTSEDGLVEWLQVAALVMIALWAGRLARDLQRHADRPRSALYALVTVGALFVAIEEISWGQRIVGLVTPDAIAELNRQGETNVHNIPFVQRAFGLAELAAAGYALVAGLVVAVLQPRVRRLYVLVPPAFLASAFAIPAIYRLARYTIVPQAGQSINRVGELAELSLYAGILAFVVLALRRLRAEMGRAPEPEGRGTSRVQGAS